MKLIKHENYEKLWKMRTIFDKPSASYPKYYSPTEHLGVDEINEVFKGRVTFQTQMVWDKKLQAL
jgi:hypothetical protein